MALIQTRRDFISGIAGAATAGLVGAPRAAAEEGILETATVRLEKDPGICRAPQYIAEALLCAEGFTDIRHVKRGSSAEINEALAKKQPISVPITTPTC
jgi:NitT/TauT family transport system substrate-binding protein